MPEKKSIPRRGLQILREKGSKPLLIALIRHLIPAKTRIRLKARYYRIQGHCGFGDPTRLLDVPVEQLTHRISQSWLETTLPEETTIIGGNWDRKARPFEESPKYKYISQYHDDKVNDEDPRSPNVNWDVSEDHLSDFERLYQNILSDGYQPQSELEGDGNTLDEIQVLIGREGTLIVERGYHRVAIAKTIGLNVVPVYVRARHEKWQTLRDEAWEAGSKDELSHDVRQHIDHPDIAAALRRSK